MGCDMQWREIRKEREKEKKGRRRRREDDGLFDRREKRETSKYN